MNTQTHRQFGKAGWQAIMAGIYTDPAIRKHAPLIEAAYAEELRRVVPRENKSIVRERKYNGEKHKAGLSTIQMGEIAEREVYGALTDEPLLTRELSAALGRGHSSVTKTLQKLHKQGRAQCSRKPGVRGKFWRRAAMASGS